MSDPWPPPHFCQRFFLEAKEAYNIDDFSLEIKAVQGLERNDLIPLAKYLVEAKSSTLGPWLRKALVEVILNIGEGHRFQLTLTRPSGIGGKARSVQLQERLVEQKAHAAEAYYLAGGLNSYSNGIEAAAKAIGLSAHSAKRLLDRKAIQQISLTAALATDEAEQEGVPPELVPEWVAIAVRNIFHRLAKSEYR